MERREHMAAMQELLDTAKAENRGLTEAEARMFDEHDRAISALDRFTQVGETRGVSAPPDKYEEAFGHYLRGKGNAQELRATYTSSVMAEAGFQASGGQGGYLVPQGFWDHLQISLKAYGGYEQYYQQVPTATGNPMDWPVNDPTGIVGGIIGEGTVDTFTTYTFGQGILNAWTYTSGVILASRELVQDSAFDVSQFVAARIGEAIGRAEAAHSVSGSGSGQPLGLITALNTWGTATPASGGFLTLGTATTVNLVGMGTATTTELAGNVLGPQSLAKMVKGVDAAYWGNAAWYFSPAQLVNEQNLADSYGRPLYPSLQQSSPTLLGFPVRVVASGPALTASTTGGPVFGDLGAAFVKRQVRTAEVQTLVERYADARQIGYYGYLRLDHRSNDLRAAITVKPAAT